MIRNITILAYLIVGTFLISCSDDDVKVDPTKGLFKVTEGEIADANVKLELWSEQEALVAGYNKIFFAVYDLDNNKRITDAHIHFNPVMDMGDMSHSTFTEDPEEEAVNKIFPASVAFIMPSGDMGTWTMEVHLHNHLNDLSGEIEFPITVESVSPAQSKSFVTEAEEKIFVTYYFPKGKKVGINDFEVIAFKKVTNDEFVAVEDLTIALEPEMPSMGHGSPNNVNPVHSTNGHYQGKVNFTMTGDWRLNLTLSRGETLLNELYFDVTLE